MHSLNARKPQDIAAVIKAAREDAGLSQSELADRLAFSRDYMGDLESGARNIYMQRLFRIYDALPNLFQDGLITWNLALAVDGVFYHRRMSAERIAAEANSWGLIAEKRIATIIDETLTHLDDAMAVVKPPRSVSAGLTQRLKWNVRRLLAGSEISAPKL